MLAGKIYIISGPSGVGKSTTSKRLAGQLADSVWLSGDLISAMHINGRKMPWESEEELSLIWENIISLTSNFVAFELNVVIDYVTFPREMQRVFERTAHFHTEVVYVLLWTDPSELTRRDKLRPAGFQMGERCTALYKEFKALTIPENYFINTTHATVDQVIEIILQKESYQPFEWKAK